MLTINVESAKFSAQPAPYQGNCWQWSYPQYILQWLAQITITYGSWEDQFFWRIIHKYEIRMLKGEMIETNSWWVHFWCFHMPSLWSSIRFVGPLITSPPGRVVRGPFFRLCLYHTCVNVSFPSYAVFKNTKMKSLRALMKSWGYASHAFILILLQ